MSRVSWELKKGLRSFVSLFEMLNQSIQPHVDKGEVSRSTVTTAQNYFGYYIWINDTKFFVGMYFSEPTRIYVNNEEELSLPEDIETGELIEDGWWQCKIDLDTEDAHFFARSLQSQRNYVQQTVSEAIGFAGNLTG